MATGLKQHTPGNGVPIFSTRELTKVYEMGEVQVHALRGIDLEIFAGELVVLLLGASGSGKSTLVYILGGLDTATGGGLRFNLNKDDPTNIRIDYGFGKNTSGFYLQFGEAF